jgi:hypothetical protein
MDVLTDVLTALELKGWISARRELTPPWRYDFAASQVFVTHIANRAARYDTRAKSTLTATIRRCPSRRTRPVS